MGGHSTLLVVGGSPALADAGFDLARRCEQLWSRFIPTSDISRLNWSEGAPTTVDRLTVRLVTAMIDGFFLSDGHFDPTLLPDLLAAGYTASTVDPANVTSLPDSAVSPGRPDGILIEGNTITLPVGTTLDAGGIGKGLAADIVCEWLIARGALGVLAEFGGDIVMAGEAPEGTGWRIDVENPFAAGDPLATLALEGGAVVTSSQRRRRWSAEGRERHHLIDAATHSSFDSPVQAVTVVAGAGWYGEILTKAGFAMDPQRYLEWLPGMHAAGALVDSDGAMTTTENWRDYG